MGVFWPRRNTLSVYYRLHISNYSLGPMAGTCASVGGGSGDSQWTSTDTRRKAFSRGFGRPRLSVVRDVKTGGLIRGGSGPAAYQVRVVLISPVHVG